MNNVWVLSKQFGYKMNNLEFRRQAVMSILQKHEKPPLSTGPRTTFVSHGSRHQGQHLIITCQQRLRRKVRKNTHKKL